MKIKVVIAGLLLLGFMVSVYYSDQRSRAMANCIERGVQHFKDAGQFPYVKEGLVKYLARDVAIARCGHNPSAF